MTNYTVEICQNGNHKRCGYIGKKGSDDAWPVVKKEQCDTWAQKEDATKALKRYRAYLKKKYINTHMQFELKVVII